MYNRTFWLDHIVNGQGQIIQQGTAMDQTHFNNVELGMIEANITHDLNAITERLNRDEAANNSQITIDQTLTNSTLTAVVIPSAATRHTAKYTVVPTITAFTGDVAPVIVISTLQANGFRVQAVGGTFTTLTLRLVLQGGLL